MPSPFVQHYTRPLSIISPEISRPASPSLVSPPDDQRKQILRELFASLSNSPSQQTLHNVASTFLQTQPNSLVIDSSDPEMKVLSNLVVRNIVVALYTHILDLYLSESLQVENELDWWADIERSQWNVAYYLLQTLPGRSLALARTVLDVLHTHNIPIQISTLTLSNFHRLFPSQDVLHPSVLVTSIFPHLKIQTQSYRFDPATLLILAPAKNYSVSARVYSFISQVLLKISHVVALPLKFTRQEVKHKRKDLETIRDARVEALGAVAHIRTKLEDVLQGNLMASDLATLVDSLERIVSGDQDTSDNYLPSPSQTPVLHAVPSTDYGSIIAKIATLCRQALPSHASAHDLELTTAHLHRPSRFVLVWPKLLFVPPLSLYALYTAYTSRASISQFATNVQETVHGLLTGWIVEPTKDILKTVRAGSAQSIMIQQEAVQADMDSLERMVVSLAKEQLQYTPVQLENLTYQIRAGDLTPVLKLYEEDIKNPLKSSIMGTLLRTLLIQIQKAKVDIDQALSGIDKLLKSQELTFAFVGIAPALGIVYLIGGYVTSVWQGGRGRGRYGGSRRRTQAWSALRRIERLLTSQPPAASANQFHQLPHSPTSAMANVGEVPIYPMTAGLLLLSVTRLRDFGERYLHEGSELKKAFMEDVDDLENPALLRTEKLRVVERMWRSWDKVLGWNAVGA